MAPRTSGPSPRIRSRAIKYTLCLCQRQAIKRIKSDTLRAKHALDSENPDMSKLEQKKAARFKVLHRIYEETEGRALTGAKFP